MKQEKTAVKILRKQMVMRRVLLSLLPCIAGAVYFFGWRSLGLIAWAGLVGFAVELIFARIRHEPVTEAVFVTTTIFTLIMPPTVGFHILTVGVIFSVMFTKEIFGGFGRNIFNPAIAGRCFVYICFPVALTANWAPASKGFSGALDKWTTAAAPDAITSATPMANLKSGKLVLAPGQQSKDEISFDIVTGNTVQLKRTALLKALLSGRIAGTMGVTSAVLILIGGMYLFLTKTASRTIIISVITTYAVLNQILYWFNIAPVPGAWPAVLGGGFLFGAFFMATDPVSAPKTKPAKIMFGIIIAIFTTVIRNFSIFNGGLMFSILIGNMFAPILDHTVQTFKAARSSKAKT